MCVAWLLCVSACGSGSSDVVDDAGASGTGGKDTFDAGHDAQRNAVTPGELCERLSTLQCAGEAFCCDSPGRTNKECKSEMLAGCKKVVHLDEIAMNPTTGFDAARAEAAFAGFEKLAEKCDPSIAAWGSSADGLRGLLQGTVRPGGNCAPRGAATSMAVVAAALASCEEPEAYTCLPRSTRLSGTFDWTCAEQSEAGGACFSDYNCEDGLFCDNPKRLLGARCKTRKAEGSACKLPNECASLFCRNDACAPADSQAAYCLKN
jgi:hypothetical protein